MNTPTPGFCRVIAELDTLGYDTDTIVAWAFHEDSLFRRNREQSIAALPMLAVALSSLPKSFLLLEVEAIIDRGEKLINELARVVGVRRRSVRCLIGKYPTELGNYWMDNPIELLRAVDLLIPEKIPTDRMEWSLMHRFWDGCGLSSNPQYSRVFSCVGRQDQAKDHLFSGLCMAGYTQSERRLARAFNNQIDGLRDVGEYFDFVAQWCGSGPWVTSKNLYVRNRLIRQLAGRLLTRYSAYEIIDQSQRWRRMVNHLPVPSIEHDKGQHSCEWPGLPGLPWQHQDLTIASLTNPAELYLDGSLMNHCVASYVRECQRGDSHIVSIRDASGNRLSTAEILLEEIAGCTITPVVVQHRATGNREPEERCVAALEAILARWQNESIQRELTSLVQFFAVQREQFPLQAIDAEYPEESLTEIMQEVLPDYEDALFLLNFDHRHRKQKMYGCLESAFE